MGTWWRSFMLRHWVRFLARKTAAKVLSLSPSLSLNCLAGRWWDCLKVLFTEEQIQGHSQFNWCLVLEWTLRNCRFYKSWKANYPLQCSWASLVAQLVKNPPAMQETWVWSLGWEDPLEKGKSTYSSILAWRMPWTVKSMGSQRVRLSDFHFLSERPTIGHFIWASLILIETNHCVCLSGCGRTMWQTGYLRPQTLLRLALFRASEGSDHMGLGKARRNHRTLNLGFEPGLQSWLQQRRLFSFSAQFSHL